MSKAKERRFTKVIRKPGAAPNSSQGRNSQIPLAVADIASPGTATAADCANKINAVLAELRKAAIIPAS